jgi:hypothetical protein
MRIWLGLIASACCAFASVDGVVMNATTGSPEPGVSVNLVQPGAGGMETLATVKSDAVGKFKVDQSIPPGPALLQATYQGATYTLILPPGGPTNGVQVNVYNATTDPKSAKLGQRMMVLEPSASALKVTETLLYQNDSNTTFQDAANGSAQFFLPPAAKGNVSVTINSPGGMPIQRPAQKTKQANIYKIDYPLRPGETRFDVNYSLPPSDTFSGQLAHPGDATKLVTPVSVTLSGDGIESLGQEPQTQAHIYNVKNPKYEVKIQGIGSLRDNETQAGASQEDTGAPGVEVSQARLYSRLYWVLGLTFGILAFGGLLLYRRGPA